MKPTYAKPANMSEAAWARAHGMHPTTAARLGVVSMQTAERYCHTPPDAEDPEAPPIRTDPRERLEAILAGMRRVKNGWTIEMDRRLIAAKRASVPETSIAKALGKSRGAIEQRIEKLRDAGAL